MRDRLMGYALVEGLSMSLVTHFSMSLAEGLVRRCALLGESIGPDQNVFSFEVRDGLPSTRQVALLE